MDIKLKGASKPMKYTYNLHQFKLDQGIIV